MWLAPCVAAVQFNSTPVITCNRPFILRYVSLKLRRKYNNNIIIIIIFIIIIIILNHTKNLLPVV